MLQTFTNYIHQQKLFKSSDIILLAVSGGIDSAVMCKLFHQAGFKFAIAHCNFQLRGKESTDDEKFVQQLAYIYNVPFYCKRFTTASYADKNNVSLQMAARELRYKWFEQIRVKEKYHRIATAHHQNDSIETFLFNLIRGTGISGLHGILPKKEKIIRPLLFTTKAEIENYATANNLKHREDSSNASDKYIRNKIRNQVIPLLKELNPSVETTILSDMQRLQNVEHIYRNQIEKQKKKVVKPLNNLHFIQIKELKKYNPIETYLYEFLKGFNFNSSQTNDIIHSLNAESGKQFFSSTHRLIKDRDQLIIDTQLKNNKTPTKKVEQKFLITKNQKEISISNLKLKLSTVSLGGLQIKNSTASSSVIDYATLKFPLHIRKWKKGDYFYPLGMKGKKKKLSDFFIDKKISIAEKENTWLLISDDKIVWVLGHRLDERFSITEKTSKYYFVEMQ